MIFDPLYLLVIGIGMALSFYASSLTKSRFRKYSQYTTRSRLTGAEVARGILNDNNIRDVRIERVDGELSDHYDPRTKTLRLSQSVHDSNSMAAFGWRHMKWVTQFNMQSPMLCFHFALPGYQ